jgi:hypothetical protein
MNTVKTIGVVLVVCLSLLLNGVACVLIAMSINRQPPITDADVVVAGVGNSANEITAPASPRRLVRRVIERDVAPQVTDDMLRTSTAALVERATRGEADAAAFLFELAAAQREKANAQAHAQPATTAPATSATR